MADLVTSGTVTVNCDRLNVRRGPGTGYGVIAVINRGDKKQVIGSEKRDNNIWYKILHEREPGWVIGVYVIYEKPAGSSISARPASSAVSSRPATAPSSRPASSAVSSRPATAPSSRPASSAVSSRPATAPSSRPGSSENKG